MLHKLLAAALTVLFSRLYTEIALPQCSVPRACMRSLHIAHGWRSDATPNQPRTVRAIPMYYYLLGFISQLMKMGTWSNRHSRIFIRIQRTLNFAGWQANPVEFDHLLNRSSNSWAMGSPDIVPLFTKGVPQARGISYHPHLQDFGAGDLAQLDVWTFDQFENLFRRAKGRPPLGLPENSLASELWQREYMRDPWTGKQFSHSFIKHVTETQKVILLWHVSIAKVFAIICRSVAIFAFRWRVIWHSEIQ